MYTHIYTDFYISGIIPFLYSFFSSHLQGLPNRAQKPNAKCPSWTEVLPTWLCPGLGSESIRLHHDYSKWPWMTPLTFGCLSAAPPCCPLLVVQIISESGPSTQFQPYFSRQDFPVSLSLFLNSCSPLRLPPTFSIHPLPMYSLYQWAHYQRLPCEWNAHQGSIWTFFQLLTLQAHLITLTVMLKPNVPSSLTSSTK